MCLICMKKSAITSGTTQWLGQMIIFFSDDIFMFRTVDQSIQLTKSIKSVSLKIFQE